MSENGSLGDRVLPDRLSVELQRVADYLHEQGIGDGAVAVDHARQEVERLREALLTARAALQDVARTRRSDAWGNAIAEANKALAEIALALDENRQED